MTVAPTAPKRWDQVLHELQEIKQRYGAAWLEKVEAQTAALKVILDWIRARAASDPDGPTDRWLHDGPLLWVTPEAHVRAEPDGKLHRCVPLAPPPPMVEPGPTLPTGEMVEPPETFFMRVPRPTLVDVVDQLLVGARAAHEQDANLVRGLESFKRLFAGERLNPHRRK